MSTRKYVPAAAAIPTADAFGQIVNWMRYAFANKHVKVNVDHVSEGDTEYWTGLNIVIPVEAMRDSAAAEITFPTLEELTQAEHKTYNVHPDLNWGSCDVCRPGTPGHYCEKHIPKTTAEKLDTAFAPKGNQ